MHHYSYAHLHEYIHKDTFITISPIDGTLFYNNDPILSNHRIDMAWMHLVHTSILACSRSISLIWLAYLKRKTSCISQFLEHCIHIYTHMHIHIYSCTKKDTHANGRTLIHTRICIHRSKHVQLQTDRQAQVQTNTNTRTQRKNNAYTNTYTRTKKLP